MLKNIYIKTIFSLFFISLYAIQTITHEDNPTDDTTESSSKIGASKSYDECKQEEVDTEKEKLQCLLQKSNLWDSTNHTPSTLTIDAIMHDFLSIDQTKKTEATNMLIRELLYTKIKQDQINAFIDERSSWKNMLTSLGIPILLTTVVSSLWFLKLLPLNQGLYILDLSPDILDLSPDGKDKKTDADSYKKLSLNMHPVFIIPLSIVISIGTGVYSIKQEINNTKTILNSPWQQHINVLKSRLKPDEFADLDKRASTIFDAYCKEFPRIEPIHKELVATFFRTK